MSQTVLKRDNPGEPKVWIATCVAHGVDSVEIQVDGEYVCVSNKLVRAVKATLSAAPLSTLSLVRWIER